MILSILTSRDGKTIINPKKLRGLKMFKIEKKVPVKEDRMNFPFNQLLEKHDSFAVPKKMVTKLRYGAIKYMEDNEGVFLKVRICPNDKEMYRVWLVDEAELTPTKKKKKKKKVDTNPETDKDKTLETNSEVEEDSTPDNEEEEDDLEEEDEDEDDLEDEDEDEDI